MSTPGPRSGVTINLIKGQMRGESIDTISGLEPPSGPAGTTYFIGDHRSSSFRGDYGQDSVRGGPGADELHGESLPTPSQATAAATSSTAAPASTATMGGPASIARAALDQRRCDLRTRPANSLLAAAFGDLHPSQLDLKLGLGPFVLLFLVSPATPGPPTDLHARLVLPERTAASRENSQKKPENSSPRAEMPSTLGIETPTRSGKESGAAAKRKRRGLCPPIRTGSYGPYRGWCSARPC